MKLVVLVFFICSSVINADPQQDWYQAQLNTNVLPPYRDAYQILQTRVVNELLSVNITALDEVSVTQLANRLLCAARDVRASLDRSVAGSNELRNQIDTKVTSSVNQIGAYEQNIVEKEVEIEQTNQHLRGAEAALDSAKRAVLDKEASVNAADAAVRAAEDVVEKAKKCHGLLGRRKRSDRSVTNMGRSWFSSITRPIVKPIENAIKDVIIKPVCSIINMGPLNDAKGRLDTARQELQSARNQEAQYRVTVANHQAHKNSLVDQLVQFQASLSMVQTALRVLQDELAITITINDQLKKAGAQLSSVHVGSIALQTAVINIIDFDQVLIPLNAIYAAMEKVTAMDTTMHIPPLEVEQAKLHLAQLAIIVPNIPFNTNTDLFCFA